MASAAGEGPGMAHILAHRMLTATVEPRMPAGTECFPAHSGNQLEQVPLTPLTLPIGPTPPQPCAHGPASQRHCHLI